MSPINKELLTKYIRGQYSPEDEYAVLHWLDENDIEDYQRDFRKEQAQRSLDKNWTKLAKRIDELKIVTPVRHRLKLKWLKG